MFLTLTILCALHDSVVSELHGDCRTRLTDLASTDRTERAKIGLAKKIDLPFALDGKPEQLFQIFVAK